MREVGSSSASPFVDGGERNSLVSSPPARDLMRMQRFCRSDVCESANSRDMLDFEFSPQELDYNSIERKDSIEMAFIEKAPMRQQVEDFNYCLEPSINGNCILNLFILSFVYLFFTILVMLENINYRDPLIPCTNE